VSECKPLSLGAEEDDRRKAAEAGIEAAEGNLAKAGAGRYSSPCHCHVIDLVIQRSLNP
jgi:hypothetical protein